jgi:hypothetical protein
MTKSADLEFYTLDRLVDGHPGTQIYNPATTSSNGLIGTHIIPEDLDNSKIQTSGGYSLEKHPEFENIDHYLLLKEGLMQNENLKFDDPLVVAILMNLHSSKFLLLYAGRFKGGVDEEGEGHIRIDPIYEQDMAAIREMAKKNNFRGRILFGRPPEGIHYYTEKF